MSKEAPKKKLSMPKYMNFIIGGGSGMMAICIVQPADLLKTRMQLLGPAAKDASFVGVAQNIVKKEGFLGFYTGISAALLRQATYGTGRLGAFNGFIDMYSAKYGVPSFPVKIVLGMVAGAFGAWIGTPAEVALIRMTADGRLAPEKRRNYTNVFNALGRMTREEGITTLWRGAGATVTRAMVVNGAQLGSYSQNEQELGGEPIRAAALRSFLSRRSGSGYTLQRDPTRQGNYYVELRVYNARDAEALSTDRWKRALVTFKSAVDDSSPVWKAVTKLVTAAKEDYQKIQPILYQSNVF